MKWSKSNNYSAEDLMAMQKDAMERVREMQRRSDERLRQSNAAIPKPMRPPIAPQHPSQSPSQTEGAPSPSLHSPQAAPCLPAEHPIQHGSPAPAGGKISQALHALGIDEDRMILLAVLLLLYNDGADYTLLLAILYLLL